MNTFLRCCLWSGLAACVALAGTPAAAEPPAFRTDDGPNTSLPWFQLVEGQFPPAGSAHYFAGELTQADPLERKFVVRPDRTDAQRRSHFDLPVAAALLPYGSMAYHGAPAALRDLPIGTHLHGWYYLRHPDDKTPPLELFYNRRSLEGDFTRCLRLEDDFTYHTRRGEQWRVDQVRRDERKLAATLLRDGQPVGESRLFDLQGATRFYKGRGFATLDDVQAGQLVQLNLTWATLYGPGRLVEVWLDEESRALATQHQLEKHRDYLRERGLPGWVDAVDNQQRIVTITLFDDADPKLLDELVEGQSAGVAVAAENLLAYDPVNDRKSGPVLKVRRVAASPGSSGVQIQVQPSLLLEGYRPTRIVRVYPSGWPVIAMPREEELFGR